MHEASENRARRVRVAAIFFCLVIVFGAARFDLYFRAPMLEHGDIAVNALQIDNAKRFSELYGNYSRFEFNHPGPAFFYAYAAAEFLLFDWLHLVPSPANAHLVGCMALQSLFFALALGVISSHLRWRALAPLALLAAALYFGSLGAAFVSIWPPHVLLMPFLCFLVSCVSVGTGRVHDWPLAVVAGGFLFHGHVAQALFVCLLGGLALALSLWQLRPPVGGRWREVAREHRGLLAVCAPLVCIILAPLVIDVLTHGSRGNVATIIGRFLSNMERPISTFKSSLYFLSFGTAATNQPDLLSSLGPQTSIFFTQNAWRIAAWVVVAAVPPVVAFRSRTLLTPGERRFFLTAGAFLATSVLGCILWGKAQAGGMHHFNGFFYYAIYYCGLLCVLALVSRGLERVAGLPVNLLAIPAAILAMRSFAAAAPGESESGLPVQRGVAAALAADPDPRPKLLVFEHTHWPAAAAVALELQRRGVGFYVAPWWNFMFQARHDLTLLGPAPEDQLAVWWISPPASDGSPITAELGIHTRPGAIRPGDEIHLQGDANGFRYVVSGISFGNIEYANTNFPRAVFRFAPQRMENDVSVVIEAEAVGAPEPRSADVFFNGEPMGQVAAAARGLSGVRIPMAVWNRRPVGTLELRFPDAQPHRDRQRPDYQWWSAWNLWGIRFEAATPVTTGSAVQP